MTKLITSLFLLLFLTSFSQQKLSEINIEENISFESPYQLEEYYFQLPKLKTSVYEIYFRFNYYNQIIDIYSSDSVNFEGKLLNQIIESKPVKVKGQKFKSLKKIKYLYEITNIDSKVATEIGNLIIIKNISEIPSNRSINDWSKNWSDCGGVNFQFKIKSEITNSAFTCPWENSEGFSYMPILKDFFENVKTTLNVEQKHKDFENMLLKKRTYSNGLYTFYKS